MTANEEGDCIFCLKGSENKGVYKNGTCDCIYVYHAQCWNKYVTDHSSHTGEIPMQIPCPACKFMVTRVNTHLKNSKRDMFVDSSPVICCGCFGAILAGVTA